MLKEFKEFAMKGSVLDMAIGIIIGGAFSPIVKSLVDDVLMPPIGMLLGGVDFSNMFAVLREGAEAAGPYEALAAAQQVTEEVMQMICETIARCQAAADGTLQHEGAVLTSERVRSGSVISPVITSSRGSSGIGGCPA